MPRSHSGSDCVHRSNGSSSSNSRINGHSSHHRSSGLLRISEAAQLLNCSPSSLRLWESQGVLDSAVYRTPLGHRRFDRNALLSAFGIETEETREDEAVHSAIYIRVSSQKQKDDGSLDRQRSRMQEFVRDEHGLGESDYTIFADCASAFGRREQLNRLVSLVLSGAIRTVFTEHLDRLSRTGSERELLQFLFDAHGVELVCAQNIITDTTEQNYLLEECISYMTVVCNRVSSHKARKICETKFDNQDELLKVAEGMLDQGLGLWNVVKQMNSDGWTCTVKGETRPLSYQKIRKLLTGRNALRESLTRRDIIKEFLTECCDIGAENIPCAKLYDSYCEWCQVKGHLAATKNMFGTRVKKDFKAQTIRLSPKKTCAGYIGISLKSSLSIDASGGQ